MSTEYYPAYWIEMAKRAYVDGHDEAMGVIDRIVRMNPDRPVDNGCFFDIRWFWEYWMGHRFDKDAVPADLR